MGARQYQRSMQGFAALRRFRLHLLAAGVKQSWIITLSHNAIKGFTVVFRSHKRWRGKVPPVFEDLNVTVFVAVRVAPDASTPRQITREVGP